MISFNGITPHESAYEYETDPNYANIEEEDLAHPGWPGYFG